MPCNKHQQPTRKTHSTVAARVLRWQTGMGRIRLAHQENDKQVTGHNQERKP